jgi:DnaJ homolog subfamily C member 19
MLWLLLGALTLFLFLGGLRAFERASVTTIKSFLAWIAALGGISLALLLILSGRGGIALGALTLFGPLIYQRWQAYRTSQGPQQRQQGSADSGQPPPRRPTGAMTREEAYQVLGLRPGASADEIRAAHHRLMRTAHPDSGGSDWLATRINLARDVLLGSSRTHGQGKT